MSSTSPYLPPSAEIKNIAVRAPQLKELKSAKRILIIVGILTLLVVGWQWKQLEDSLAKTEASLQGSGLTMEDVYAQTPEAEEQVRFARIMLVVALVTGGLFIFLAFMVYRWPVAAPLTAVILYAGDWLAGVIGAPEEMHKGILLKIIITILLVRAVKAGLDWKRSGGGLAA